MELHELLPIYDELVNKVESKDRRYHLTTYPSCFIGKEAVDYLVQSKKVESRAKAVELLSALQENGFIAHVTKDHEFKDDNLFYRFSSLEPASGKAGEPQWSTDDAGIQVTKAGEGERDYDLNVSPLDEHNVKLLNNVKPKIWINPETSGKDNHFTLLVIGAGAGGLISAIQGAGIGLKTALIERHLLGGDCLNVGCVPSKGLLRCARAIREMRHSEEYGVSIGSLQVDFAKIMARMRKLRARIAPVDSAARYTQMGASVFQGSAKFLSKNSVEVELNENGKLEKRTLTFSKAIIATGGRAFIPPIPGIKEVKYLTNASLFNLTELPKVFGVIGSGPIGVEMAQAFAAFGSEVHVFEVGSKVLPREDPDAAKIIQTALEADGVQFHLNCNIKSMKQDGEGPILLTAEKSGSLLELEVDQLLVSTGRTPNVEELDLDNAGVKFERKGVVVSDKLQTTNKNIFAVGDVCLKYQFTHMADASAKIAFRNAFFPFQNNKVSSLVVPWCTYTSPEIAHVGSYGKELTEQGIEFEEFEAQFEHNDRAILEGDDAGFVKLLVKKGTDHILGATIVAEGAGDMISEVTVCMYNNVGANGIAGTIHPYPTEADAIRICAGNINKKRLTSTTKALLKNLAKFKAG